MSSKKNKFSKLLQKLLIVLWLWIHIYMYKIACHPHILGLLWQHIYIVYQMQTRYQKFRTFIVVHSANIHTTKFVWRQCFIKLYSLSLSPFLSHSLAHFDNCEWMCARICWFWARFPFIRNSKLNHSYRFTVIDKLHT